MREHQLMDYSIIVGVQRVESYVPGQDCGFSDSPAEGQPYTCVHENSASAYYLGIIDFLQSWTTTKSIAMMIKKPVAPQPQSTVPPDDYSLQFIRHFDQKFVGNAHSLPPTRGTATTPGTGVASASPGNQRSPLDQAGFAVGVMGPGGGPVVDAQGVHVQFAATGINVGATDMV